MILERLRTMPIVWEALVNRESVWQVRLEDGTEACLKLDNTPSYSEWDDPGAASREVATYKVAVRLGLTYLVPPTTLRLRGERLCSIQLWKPGKSHPRQKTASKRIMRDIALLDSVVGQGDRHGGNVLKCESSSRMWAIDNAYTFPPETAKPYTAFMPLDISRSRLINHHREILHRFSDDRSEVTAELRPLLPYAAVKLMWERVAELFKGHYLV